MSFGAARVRRRRRALVRLAAAMLALQVTACAPSWRRFIPPGEGFAVEMPGEPRQERYEVKTMGGPTQEHLYCVATSSTPGAKGVLTAMRTRAFREPNALCVFVAAGQRVDPAAIAREARELYLRELEKPNRLREGVARLSGGEVNGTEEVMRAEMAGLPYYLRARTFVVGDRVYGLSVIGRQEGSVTSATADRFFTSFRILSTTP